MTARLVGSAPAAVLAPLALLGLLLLPGTAPVTGEVGALRARGQVSDPQALWLLDRASRAADQVSYRGTQFVSAWTRRGSTSLVAQVSHLAGRGTTVRSPATASRPADSTYVPAAAVEPSLLGGASALTLLGRHYRLTLAPPGTVAGRRADVVVVRRLGSARPAARFWLDHGTGLVLRREVYDENGRVTRASAFVDVAVGSPRDANRSVRAGRSAAATEAPRAWTETVDRPALDRMRGRGWTCPDSLGGKLQLVDARRGGGDYRGIVHLSYSDGLASVSVFEQRGRLRADDLEGYRATTVRGRRVHVLDGVPQRLVWASGGTVYMVVADASPRTEGDVLEALPGAGGAPAGWQRLGRGLDRVASWFNPFG